MRCLSFSELPFSIVSSSGDCTRSPSCDIAIEPGGTCAKNGKPTHPPQVKAQCQNAFDFVFDTFWLEMAFDFLCSLHFSSKNRSDTRQSPQHGVQRNLNHRTQGPPPRAASTASRAHGEGVGSSHRDRAIEGDATRASKLRRRKENRKKLSLSKV